MTWLLKILIYGNLGVLVEFYFTAFSSLFKRNWKLTGYSYLWMLLPYGLTALLLESIGEWVPWPFYFKAFLYVPIIYGVEALSGYALLLLTKWLQKGLGGSGGGVVPWEYAKSKWSLSGLIELRYFPFWLLLAMAFGPINGIIHKVLRIIGTVG